MKNATGSTMNTLGFWLKTLNMSAKLASIIINLAINT